MPFGDFKPLNDLVLVKRVEEDNSTAGSFIIPEKFRQQSNKGIVVAVPEDEYPDFGAIQVGDRVTFGVYNAENIIINGEEFLLIREGDIRGVEKCLAD